MQGGVKVSLDRWRGIGAQGFGQPDIQPLVGRRVGRLAPLRGRGVPARPRRAEDRVRLGPGRERLRPRHPGALADRPQERAVAERGVHDRQRDLGSLHGADRRRAVPDAAQPGGPDAGAALPAEHRQRHRHVRRRRQPEDRSTGARSSSASSTTCPSPTGALWVSANYSQLKSNNIVSLTPENSRGGVFYWQEYFDANAYAALTPAVQLGAFVPVHAPVLRRSPVRRRPPRSRTTTAPSWVSASSSD